jgi:hypothetical protein
VFRVLHLSSGVFRGIHRSGGGSEEEAEAMRMYSGSGLEKNEIVQEYKKLKKIKES